MCTARDCPLFPFEVWQIVVVGQSWLVSACRWPALDQDMIAEWTGLGSWASLRRKYVSNNAIRPCSSWWYQLKRPCPQCPTLVWGDKVSKVRLKLKISTTQVQMSRLARANVAWVEFEELRLHHIERNFTACDANFRFPRSPDLNCIVLVKWVSFSILSSWIGAPLNINSKQFITVKSQPIR